MKKVLLRAPLLTKSGYGVHARQIARWLFDKEEKEDLDISCELLNWGTTPWITDIEAQDGLISKIVQASLNTKQFYDISLQLQLPNEWNPFLGSYNIGITAGVEVDKCNPSWIDSINRMQLVIVPSEFTKQVFLNSGKVTTPIVVVPESFPDSMLKKNLSSSEVDIFSGKLETTFNFLVVGQITGNNPENDRKNLFYTIKWAAEAFSGKKDVGFIIKSNASRLTHLDRNMVVSAFNRILTEVHATNVGPKFYLLHGDLSEEEMKDLYCNKNIKALVSLTRGEGFGLPILESAACGLPVIATNWSAHTEFLNLGKWVKVDYNLSPIHQTRVDNNIFFPESKWAQTIEVDAKKRMLKFYESPVIPQKWAKELQEKMQENYCFEKISEQLTKATISSFGG